MNRWGRSRAWIAAIVVAASGLVACGGGDVGVARPFDVEITGPEEGRVTVSMPSSVGAGLVSMRIKNSGHQLHDAQLVRVTGNQTRDEVIRFFRSMSEPNFSIPSWIRGGGGARGIPIGETVSVKQRLDEGDWYLVDTAFLERGGVVPFTVSSGGSAADLPSATSRVRARDFTFEPRAIRPGTHEVRFENRGRQMHEMVAMRLLDGKTFEDAKAYFAGPTRIGPPSAAPVDLVSPVRLPMLDRAESVVTELTLTRGTWVIACLLPDRTGGPIHATKGMLAEVKVG